MRKPRDIDGELRALQERARELRTKKTVQFGELVAATGADALPVEALAGVLLAAAEQAKEKPEAVARWTERGQAFFRASGEARKRGGRGKEARDGTGAGTSGPGSAAAQADGDGG
jgi:hypothetical protein